MRTEIWVVFRTFPIRVAGNSGPMVSETSWQALNLPEEMTTVTKRVRRVGGWDAALAYQALLANGGPAPWVCIALTMVDQISPGATGVTIWEQLPPDAREWVERIGRELNSKVQLIGTSDRSMVDRRPAVDS